jgi:hypothetical protein
MYRGVSGLNFNIAKIVALFVSIPPAPLYEQLCLLGMATPNNSKYLGILLGNTINFNVEAIMVCIEPRAMKWHIIATMPLTDMLHRTKLITTALLPVYDHFFMSLPVEPAHITELYRETRCFQWTKQVDGQTEQ